MWLSARRLPPVQNLMRGRVSGFSCSRRSGPVSVPLIAIGGINAGNVADVIAAGADGVAVISAVVGEDDLTAAARDLRARIAAAKQDR